MQPSLFEPDHTVARQLDNDGDIWLTPCALPGWAAWIVYDDIRDHAQWKQDYLTIGDKQIPFPRLTAWYGDPGMTYEYAGVHNTPLPWFAGLSNIKDWVERITGARYNSVLLNYYRDGDSHLGWHSDSESDLGDEPTIASLSLGATRLFQMASKFDAFAPMMNIELYNGSLLVMKGQCQKRWRHRIVKQPGRAGARINLTFRLVVK